MTDARSEGPEDDYRLLHNELMRLMLGRQLSSFVTTAPVQKPNGEPVRSAASDGRASTAIPNKGAFNPGTDAVSSSVVLTHIS
jgi:hypothetical protein